MTTQLKHKTTEMTTQYIMLPTITSSPSCNVLGVYTNFDDNNSFKICLECFRNKVASKLMIDYKFQFPLHGEHICSSCGSRFYYIPPSVVKFPQGIYYVSIYNNNLGFMGYTTLCIKHYWKRVLSSDFQYFFLHTNTLTHKPCVDCPPGHWTKELTNTLAKQENN